MQMQITRMLQNYREGFLSACGCSVCGLKFEYRIFSLHAHIGYATYLQNNTRRDLPAVDGERLIIRKSAVVTNN